MQPTGARIGHRPDLDGIRAVAVALVIGYHAGFAPLAGGFVGVDVFFVLSGFLITGLLADELTRDGRLSLVRFYGRRARRLLPMSALVLVVTAATFGYVSAPINDGGLFADIRSAALYFANWHFAASSVDYLSSPDRSPVLHYWSLSVEEQFYLLWPVLLLVAWRLARRRGHTGGRAMVVAVTIVTTCSFVASAVLTPGRGGAWSYYGLHTRAWELGAGALLALTYRRWQQLQPAIRQAAGWLGLAAVVASAFVIDGSTAFPGTAALLPVAGTVGLVVAGSGSYAGASRWLALGPVTYVGRISYAWYLWHWPVLLATNAFAEGVPAARDSLGVTPARGWLAVLAIVISFALSAASHHVLENPVRRSHWLALRPIRSIRLAAALTAGAIGAAALILPATAGSAATIVTVVGRDAAGRTATSAVRQVQMAVSPRAARADAPTGTGDCYTSFTGATAAGDCQLGDPTGTHTVVLVGDSHAQQLVPAFVRAARQEHWRLYVWTKPACPFIDLQVRLPQFARSYPWCDQWRASVLDQLRAIGPVDAVVVAQFAGAFEDAGRFASADGTAVTPGNLRTTWRAGWASTRQSLSAVARHVVVVHDTPYVRLDVPSCLSWHTTDATACAPARQPSLADADTITQAEASVPGTNVIDPDRILCPGDPCPVLWSDGTVMYRDDRHLTATMAAKLAPLVRAQLSAILQQRAAPGQGV